ncbi:hypothetical protein LXL04_029144 [Taraxacum kok-saghyz]
MIPNEVVEGDLIDYGGIPAEHIWSCSCRFNAQILWKLRKSDVRATIKFYNDELLHEEHNGESKYVDVLKNNESMKSIMENPNMQMDVLFLATYYIEHMGDDPNTQGYYNKIFDTHSKQGQLDSTEYILNHVELNFIDRWRIRRRNTNPIAGNRLLKKISVGDLKSHREIKEVGSEL